MKIKSHLVLILVLAFTLRLTAAEYKFTKPDFKYNDISLKSVAVKLKTGLIFNRPIVTLSWELIAEKAENRLQMLADKLTVKVKLCGDSGEDYSIAFANPGFGETNNGWGPGKAYNLKWDKLFSGKDGAFIEKAQAKALFKQKLTIKGIEFLGAEDELKQLITQKKQLDSLKSSLEKKSKQQLSKLKNIIASEKRQKEAKKIRQLQRERSNNSITASRQRSLSSRHQSAVFSDQQSALQQKRRKLEAIAEEAADNYREYNEESSIAKANYARKKARIERQIEEDASSSAASANMWSTITQSLDNHMADLQKTLAENDRTTQRLVAQAKAQQAAEEARRRREYERQQSEYRARQEQQRQARVVAAERLRREQELARKRAEEERKRLAEEKARRERELARQREAEERKRKAAEIERKMREEIEQREAKRKRVAATKTVNFSLNDSRTTSGKWKKGIAVARNFVFKDEKITTLRLKFSFDHWMQEPLRVGAMAWEAGDKVPDSLFVSPIYTLAVSYPGGTAYVDVSPMPSKKGRGYVGDISGSPSWSKMFKDSSGSYLDEKAAKNVYKTATSASIYRIKDM